MGPTVGVERAKEVKTMRIELWDEFAALQRQMDDVFGDFFVPRTRTVQRPLAGGLRRPFVPATDVYVKDGKRIIRVEIPGIDPEQDLSLTLEDGYLVINGERARREEVKEEELYRVESFYGTFRRYFPIPEGLDEMDIKADYVDGILEITMPAVAPKPLEAKTAVIPVHTRKVTAEKVA
jgi:HSP20 family protein